MAHMALEGQPCPFPHPHLSPTPLPSLLAFLKQHVLPQLGALYERLCFSEKHFREVQYGQAHIVCEGKTHTHTHTPYFPAYKMTP